MEADRLVVFRKLLNSRLDALLEGASGTIAHLTQPRESLTDEVDIAVDEINRDFVLRLQDRDRRLVEKIREALERTHTGEYGLCVACGEDIDERRLMARPVATHCIDCKTEVEAAEMHRSRLF